MKRISLYSKRMLTGACIVFAFAIVEEFTQIAFESRTFDFFDMLCDLTGIILFSYASIRWKSRKLGVWKKG